MSLKRLLNRKKLTVLGLNSGTSADGLDLAVLSVDRSRGGYRLKQLDGGTHKYPDGLRRLLFKLTDSEKPSLDDLVHLDQAVGVFFGRSAAAFVSRKNLSVDLVASHGQTVRHLPQVLKFAGHRVRGTLQIGNLNQIAARTGVITVGDYRQADVSVGGEGAPITTAAMQRIFADQSKSRLIVNIGGVANYFYFPAVRARLSPAAADCGPGNSLVDLMSRKLFRTACDRGGRLARRGHVSPRLLTLLYRSPVFDLDTQSTGRERFGPSLAERIVKHGRKLKLSRYDLMATTAELTVAAIADHLRTFIDNDPRLDKLYLTGGGSHNRFFRRRLQERLGEFEVDTVSALGFNPDLVEAAAFAVMGEACLRGEPTAIGIDRPGLPSRGPVAGLIAQPPRTR